MGRRVQLAVIVLALGACGGSGEPEQLRAKELVVKGRTHLTVDPGPPRRPLLVLLHGRGMEPDDLLWQELYDELKRLGDRAPALLVVEGGEHSYYHDRRDFAWGTHTLRAIEAARRALHTRAATAIGGISMGGFGAFDLARSKAFCAVGGHSPAIFRSGAETPAGAFDDAEDFAAHDVLRFAREGERFHGARLWLDVGRDDPFRATTIELAKLSGARLNVWPGGHDTRYWRSHVADYLRFYADALANC